MTWNEFKAKVEAALAKEGVARDVDFIVDEIDEGINVDDLYITVYTNAVEVDVS